jgi:hypothetical protein
MGILRDVEVCMAPSVALRSGEAATMGGVAEQAILRDYLIECSRTPPNPFQSPQATREEWWDTGNRDNYKAILLERHSEINEQKLRGINKLKVPDISTWKGKYQRNKIIDPSQPDERNELYEIKPDSAWGIAAGIEKMKGMEDNFRDLGLRGYKFGSWYPAPPGNNVTARKEIPFIQLRYIAESFDYRLRRMERSMTVLGATLRIKSVMLEVERRYSGVLYYKICVKMTLDFNGAENVARRVIRRLYQGLTATLKEEQRLRELELGESYRIMDSKGKPVPEPQPPPADQKILKGLDTEEKFLIEKITLVDELENSVRSLGQALFTRLRGLPGERFIVCCDDIYYENEIRQPAKVRLSRALQKAQVRLPIGLQASLALTGAINVPLSYALAGLYVLTKSMGDPRELLHAPENYRAAQQWLMANPAQSLIIGGIVVYGSALVVAGTIATGGALFVPAAGAAGAAAPSGLAVQGAGRMAGYGLARELAGEAIKEAALPAAERVLPVAAEQAGLRISQEAARQVAVKEAEVLMTRQLGAAAQSQIEKAAMRAAMRELAAERTRRAIEVAGATLGAATLRVALEGAAANTPGAAPSGAPAILAAEVGCLHLLKLKDGADLDKLPQLYAEADYRGYADDWPGGLPFPPPAPIKLYHLGVLRCL